MREGHGKPIVFIDFHGTICHDRYWRSLPQDKQADLQAFLFRENSHIVDEWMRGFHTAEAVNRLVAAALHMPYEELWNTFVADCRSMHVPQSTLDRAEGLRSLARTVLMTGNMDSFSCFTVPSLRLDTYFDVISNSYNEGRLKTDECGALYLQYADQYGVPIEDCVAIDDAEDVCATFAGLGGTALRVTADRNVDAALESLRGLSRLQNRAC